MLALSDKQQGPHWSSFGGAALRTVSLSPGGFSAQLIVVLAVVGCGSSDRAGAASETYHLGGASNSSPGIHLLPGADPCGVPEEGCECEDAGEMVDCGTVTRYAEDYVTCSFGEITCGDDGLWGECKGDTVSVLPIPPTGNSTTTK